MLREINTDIIENQCINLEFSILLIEEIANALQKLEKTSDTAHATQLRTLSIKQDLVLKLLYEAKNGLDDEIKRVFKE